MKSSAVGFGVIAVLAVVAVCVFFLVSNASLTGVSLLLFFVEVLENDGVKFKLGALNVLKH